MTQIDRRQWLRTMGITGSMAFLGNFEALSKPLEDLAFRPRLISTPIKLNSNENPYGPSEKVKQAMVNSFDIVCRYPFAYTDQLVNMIAKKEGVSRDHIVIASGSTEGLRITGLTYGMNGGEVVAADPTFLALLTYAEQFGARIHKVPVDEMLNHDLEEMYTRINSNTKLVFVCNPNNPTSTIIPAKKLKDFCASVSNKSIVFCDEAYCDYVEDPDYESMVPLVKKGENVIVSRTFSKVYGLAGIRIGYLIAKPEIASTLNKNLAAFTNVLALKAAQTALEETDFYNFSLAKNKDAKSRIYQTLDKLGLDYVKSHTNFVFFKSGRPIGGLITDMRAQGVLIGRPFPPLTDWCRISTGTPEEIDAFNQALIKVMS